MSGNSGDSIIDMLDQRFRTPAFIEFVFRSELHRM